MSERRKKRGRPRAAPMLSYGNEIKVRNNISRTIKKPKYLRDDDELDQDESLGSTVDGEVRASLASGSDFSTPKSRRPKITSNSINSRGYNPQVTTDKNSEYHYGSDFDSDDEVPGQTPAKDILGSDVGSLSDGSVDLDMEQDADEVDEEPDDPSVTIGPGFVPFWKLGPAGNLGTRAQTPVPVWLRDIEYPALDLPKSSEDLLMPQPFVLQAVSIYEVLRNFRSLVRLTPFRFEDFSAAMICEEQTTLLSEVHIALLKALIREEESQQTHFGPLDQKDSINITLFFIDAITWPAVILQFLQSDPEYKQTLEILEGCNYPFTSLNNRLKVLQFLTDQYLQTNAVRDHILSEGKIRYDDHCRVCHKTGDLLCCDSCMAVYHLECTDPPLRYAPSESEDWTCNVCKIHQVDGVTECGFSMETTGAFCRQDPLGYDRHGRKYWFLVRRIFVESDEGDIWYYSNPAKIDCLLATLDSTDLEEGLCICLREYEDDIRTQMELTQTLTEKNKGSRIAYLTIERGESLKQLKVIKDEQTKREEELMAEIKRDKDELLLKEKEELKKESELLDSMIEEVKEEPDFEGNVEVKEEKVESDAVEVKKESVDKKEEKPLEGKCISQSKGVDRKPKLKNFEEKVAKVYDEQVLNLLTKEKSNQFLSTVNIPYRLGCDLSNRSYVNLYHL